ncbi:uncharacterized protein LOC141666129 [Apium graveolens]|uniref:uncharacterized protein LOC141666129 n=1 Tax=Apium graveolens TaxID=4045 RepID=UPI003D795093
MTVLKVLLLTALGSFLAVDSINILGHDAQKHLNTLKGDNFDEWTPAIGTSLRAKKKIGFIDGSITQPSETTDEYEDWISVNLMLVSWIMNTIDSKLRSTISYHESARDLWIYIQERFNISNGPRIQQPKAELHTCKQIQGMSIEDYYAKLKKLWEALVEVDPIPIWECGKCTCNIATKLEKREENAKVHQFLMGVDDGLYETNRSTLLAADEIGGINKIYSSLIREERLRMGTNPTPSLLV